MPDVTTLPLLMFTASMDGNYQIAVDHRADPAGAFGRFMLVIERFLKAEVLAKVGA